MIKYYKDTNDKVHKLEENEYNTIEQLLSYNPQLVEEVTEADWQAQQPTQEELIRYERWKRYEEELPMGDQIDAIWKSLEQIGGLPQEAVDIITKRNQIKQDLPK